MEFTGEFYIPGKTEKRIERDHISRYKFAKRYVKNKTVLDIACGVGYGGDLLKDYYKSYSGVDISSDNINFANHHYKNTKSEYVEGDILTFIGGPFDVVICFETIEHVAEYKLALSRLYENLQAGGMLIISSPNRSVTSKNAIHLQDKPENKYHTQEFLPDELKTELINMGFESNMIAVYGQRQARKFNSQWAQKAYNFLYKPSKRASSSVKRVKNKTPRYFILLAQKV